MTKIRKETQVHKFPKDSRDRGKTFCFVCRCVNICKCNPKNPYKIRFSGGTKFPSSNSSNTRWNKFFSANKYLLRQAAAGNDELITQCNDFLANINSSERIKIISNGSMTMINNIYDLRHLILDGIGTRDLNNNYDYSSITDYGALFHNCGTLETVPMLYTDRVTNMTDMFAGCVNLKNVPRFNTNNVMSMYAMFHDCTSLQGVPTFNTKSALSMESMFQGCINLKKAPSFNTSNVRSMIGMFCGCSSLKSVPKYDVSNLENPDTGWLSLPGWYDMFKDCNNLRDLDIPSYPDYDFSNLNSPWLREKYPEFFI